jgi:phosphoribosylglycinamide formyltransferase 1
MMAVERSEFATDCRFEVTPMHDAPRDPPFETEAIRLAVCVSGEGTSLQNLIDLIQSKRLDAKIVQVVASKPRIGAIPRAEAAHIPLALAVRGAKTPSAFSASVFDPIRSQGADLVVLAGFLSLVEIPTDYRGRVINIHPSLIPAFCGKGFHGRGVHESVLEYGAKISGCTVHFADDAYDTGPIILQRSVAVLENDTAESLAERVFQAECQALPEAISLYAAGRLRIEGRRVRVLGPR